MSGVSEAAELRLSREEQKARTREAIRVAALDLFEELGLEKTTIDQIVAVAGIGRRTFFRYFSSKEAVLFGDELLPGIPDNIDRCLREGMSPLDAAFASLRDSVAYLHPPTETEQRRRRFRAEALALPGVSLYYRNGIATLATRIAATIREYPEHSAVPFLPELIGGIVQTVLLEHVDSGEISHLRFDEESWRGALRAALASSD